MQPKSHFLFVVVFLVLAGSLSVTSSVSGHSPFSSHSKTSEGAEHKEQTWTTETLFDDVLQWGVQNKIISQEQREKLTNEYLQRLEKLKASTGRFSKIMNTVIKKFTLSHVLYFGGALIIVGGVTFFSTLAIQIFRGGGLLSIALLYAAFFVWLGNQLWNTTQYQIVGGLLYVVVVCLTPLAVYGFELVTGLWIASPNTSDTPTFRDFQYQIKGCWIAMEVTTLLVGLLMIYFVPFTFLVVPIAVTLWFMSMDVAPLIFGEFQISFKQRAHLSSIFGLMVLIVAWLLDQITTLDWSFWLYLFGGLSFSCGLIWYFADEDPIQQMIFLSAHVGLIYFSYSLSRTTLLVYGAIGLFCYYVSVNFQFSKRIVVSRSVVYSHALMAVILLALAYRSHFERTLGDVEFLLSVLTIVSYNLMWFKLAISSTEIAFLIHLFTNIGFVSLAKYFNFDISLYFFHIHGSTVLEIAAAIGILGNNFGAKLLEVEACADRNLYHSYRFFLDFSQVLLALLYPHSHILVLCGCSGMLFHVWIAAFYKHPDWRVKYAQGIVDISLLWFILFITTLFSQKTLFVLGCVMLGWLLAVLEGKSHLLTCCAIVGTIFVAVLLDSTLLMSLSGVFLFIWLSHISGTLFKDSILFPFALVFIGLVMIFLGMEWQLHQEWIRVHFFNEMRSILNYLPFPKILEENVVLSFPPDLSSLVENGITIPTSFSVVLHFLCWPHAVFCLFAIPSSILFLEKYLSLLHVLHDPIQYVPLFLLVLIVLQILRQKIQYFDFSKEEDKIDNSLPPAIQVSDFKIYYPSDTDNHGIVLEVHGTKDSNFVIDSAKLSIEGEEFWHAVDTLIGAGFVAGFKMAFYPIELHSKRMNLNAFQRGVRNIKIIIQLATGLNGEKRISHDTIRTTLRRLMNLGDPNFTVQVVYFSKKMRPPKGILFSIPLRPSSLLNSPQTHYQLKKELATNWKKPQNKK